MKALKEEIKPKFTPIVLKVILECEGDVTALKSALRTLAIRGSSVDQIIADTLARAIDFEI
jgi:hypothetical protein